MQQKSVRSSSESYFWPTIWAVAIHVLLFAMLFVSFHFAPELPPARPIVQATLYQLKSQSQATTQTNQKIAGEAQKTKARQYEVEQLETKKEEQQKQEAAEQKKVAAAKQDQAEDIRLGGPDFYLDVVLTTRGGAVRSVTLPKFQQASELGLPVYQRTADGTKVPAPLPLVLQRGAEDA